MTTIAKPPLSLEQEVNPWEAKHLPYSVVKIQFVSGEIKSGGLRLPRVHFLFERERRFCDSRHGDLR